MQTSSHLIWQVPLPTEPTLEMPRTSFAGNLIAALEQEKLKWNVQFKTWETRDQTYLEKSFSERNNEIFGQCIASQNPRSKKTWQAQLFLKIVTSVGLLRLAKLVTHNNEHTKHFCLAIDHSEKNFRNAHQKLMNDCPTNNGWFLKFGIRWSEVANVG